MDVSASTATIADLYTRSLSVLESVRSRGAGDSALAQAGAALSDLSRRRAGRADKRGDPGRGKGGPASVGRTHRLGSSRGLYACARSTRCGRYSAPAHGGRRTIRCRSSPSRTSRVASASLPSRAISRSTSRSRAIGSASSTVTARVPAPPCSATCQISTSRKTTRFIRSSGMPRWRASPTRCGKRIGTGSISFPPISSSIRRNMSWPHGLPGRSPISSTVLPRASPRLAITSTSSSWIRHRPWARSRSR